MGLEYYGSLGPVSGFDPVRRQQHLIFPAVDLKLGQMGIQRRRRVRPHSRDRRRDRQADRWLSLRFPRRPSVGRTTALCDKLLSAEPCTLQQISGRSDDGTQAGRPRYRRGRRDGAHADPSAHRERVRDAVDRHVAHERDKKDYYDVAPRKIRRRACENQRADGEVELVEGIHGSPGSTESRRLKKLLSASPIMAPKPKRRPLASQSPLDTIAPSQPMPARIAAATTAVPAPVAPYWRRMRAA
jgi:hypothetical protein